MMTKSPGQIGSVLAEIDGERRIAALEFGQRDSDKRLTALESWAGDFRRGEERRAAVLATIKTQLARVLKDVEKMSSDQQRFIIGATLALGGIIISIARVKLGL